MQIIKLSIGPKNHQSAIDIVVFLYLRKRFQTLKCLGPSRIHRPCRYVLPQGSEKKINFEYMIVVPGLFKRDTVIGRAAERW